MNARKRWLKDAADLVAGKRALGDKHLGPSQPSTAGAPRAWFAHSRVSDARRHSSNQLHAIGIGRKRVEGKLTSTLCVRLYVAQKLPRHQLTGLDVLPPLIDGIPTDVVEAPPAYLAATSPCSFKKLREQRPAQGGISGAHESIQAGTLAARCRSRRPQDSADRFVLGNCHTFADLGHAQAGSAILQPSPHDGADGATRLAALDRTVQIVEDPSASNRVDAAIARLASADLMIPGICTVGTIQGTTDAAFETRVHKHGRTTGYTAGIVDDPSIDILLPLRRDDPGKLTRFVDQVRIRPQPGQFVFAQPGDSGALVLTKADNLAVGLLFACPDNGSFAYANPIDAVLDALEIDLE